MTVIEIPDEQAAALTAKAAAQGLTLQEWFKRLAVNPDESAAAENHAERVGARKPVWEAIRELFADVPPEALEALPEDGLTQIDHYVYGTPKRDQ